MPPLPNPAARVDAAPDRASASQPAAPPRNTPGLPARWHTRAAAATAASAESAGRGCPAEDRSGQLVLFDPWLSNLWSVVRRGRPPEPRGAAVVRAAVARAAPGQQ